MTGIVAGSKLCPKIIVLRDQFLLSGPVAG
jgi:hypothetical protein